MAGVLGKSGRACLASVLALVGLTMQDDASSSYAQLERATQPFQANVTGSFSDVLGGVRFNGSGTVTLLGESTATMLIGSTPSPSPFTGCVTGQGSGSFVSKASGRIDFVTVETSCSGKASKGRDLDTGYFVIVGGKGAYQGAGGWGSLMGASTSTPNDSQRTFTGTLILPVGQGAGTSSPVIPPASGPFSVRTTGGISQGKDSVTLKGTAHGGKLNGGRFVLHESLSNESQKWTHCLSFRADGSFSVAKKGSVPFVAAGYSCGSGTTHTESGYWVVNAGAGRYTGAQGRGTFSGTRGAAKAGTFKLTFHGTMTGF